MRNPQSGVWRESPGIPRNLALKIVGDLLWVGGDLGYAVELAAAYMHPNLRVSVDVAEPIGRSATCRGDNDRFPSLFVHEWRDSCHHRW